MTERQDTRTTDDFTEQVRSFAESQVAKRNQRREENRRKYPDVAAFIDQLRAEFGTVKVIRLEETKCPTLGSDTSRSVT
jgi:hypothetical protein